MNGMQEGGGQPKLLRKGVFAAPFPKFAGGLGPCVQDCPTQQQYVFTLKLAIVVIVCYGDQDGQVTHWEANAFAQDNDLHFIETSALTGENVDEAFLHCTRTILAKIKSGDLDPDRLGYGRQRNILGGIPGGDRPLPLTDTQPSVVTYHNDCSC
ncbi:hypothetical protein X801_01159 [Opisthorchis viverrini]|uniref:Ras family protein n=1 Tax=Opisthorchis viverrini TaxID=6198 RepID=A0A1S8X886_OPIVI|nr:hypothetical protein X801_01159 [Opisthorchis viverrini]